MQVVIINWGNADAAEAAIKLERLFKRAEEVDFSGTLRNTSNTIHASTLRSFSQGVDPEGNAWAPLRYRKNPPPTLVVSGLLMTAALMATANPRVSKDELLISVPVPRYGLFHLQGTRKMPARPFMGLTSGLMDKVAEAIAEDAIKQITKDQA